MKLFGALFFIMLSYVKHSTACLLGHFLLKNRTVKKVEGAMPPQSEKWRGHWPPSVPPPMVKH